MQNDQLVDAQIAKLVAETAKLNKEIKWYEIMIIATATLAIIGFSKLVLI